jgi:hypothetical protein
VSGATKWFAFLFPIATVSHDGPHLKRNGDLQEAIACAMELYHFGLKEP